MLRLALLRHSEAHAHAPGGDMERSLTKEGREMAARMGDYCRKMSLKPDFSLVSPAKRTRETFEIAAHEMRLQQDAIFDPQLYNATSTTIKELVAEVTSDQKVILVVGHNPGIAESAIALSGDGNPAQLAEMRKHFPAPALAIIDFKLEAWSAIQASLGYLNYFVTKSHLG